MISLAISVLWFLIALCVLVGIGWLVIWVLGELGITVPPMVVKLSLLILGLLCLIWFLTLLASGSLTFPGTLSGRRVSMDTPAISMSLTDQRAISSLSLVPETIRHAA